MSSHTLRSFIGNLHSTMREISWRGFIVLYNRKECENIPALQMVLLVSPEHTHAEILFPPKKNQSLPLSFIQYIYEGEFTVWLCWNR